MLTCQLTMYLNNTMDTDDWLQYKCKLSSCQWPGAETYSGLFRHMRIHHSNILRNYGMEEDGISDSHDIFNAEEPKSNEQLQQDFNRLLYERTATTAKLLNELETLDHVSQKSIDRIINFLHNDTSCVNTLLSNTDLSNYINPIDLNWTILSKQRKEELLFDTFMKKKPIEYDVDGEKLYHIKLEDALEELLLNETNYNLIKSTSTRISTDGKIHDIMDGSVYRNHPLFSQYPNALIFLLSIDDCALNNANNYTLIYVGLGNITAKYRGLLQNIAILAAIPEKIVSKLGHYKSFKAIMEDFVPFATYEVEIKRYGNKTERFYGAVLAGIFDYKAAHELGGFMTQFGQMHRFCRECLVHRLQMTSSDRMLHIPRDLEQHEIIVQQVENGSKALASIFGVKSKSVLSISLTRP